MLKVEVILSQEDEEPRVRIYTKSLNEELTQLIDFLTEKEITKQSSIIGTLDDVEYVLKLEDVYYFEANGNTILAVHKDNRYKVMMRLYEVENLVAGYQFIRVSKSIIININKIYTIERSFGTPYLITLQDDMGKVLASSQHIKLVKQRLMGV
ncbi:MAG: LytTR family DNA-binding domain-containing protein [Culicoidibacterales bacterium]